MNKDSFFYKLPNKYLLVNVFIIILLITLYISAKIPLASIGFLLDIIFAVGLNSFIFFIIGKDKIRNIIFTIIYALITILFIADHIYFTNFEKFASVTSLSNLHMIVENADAYGVSLDIVSIFIILLYIGLIFFLYTYKENNQSFKQRFLYLVPSLLTIVPFIATYEMAYNDIIKLDIILFPKRYKFPAFVENFGYLIYRFEDIATVIDSKIGG